MAYTNTFILIAADCPVEKAETPVQKKDKIPAHLIQFQLLKEYPYRFGHEDLIYQVYIRQKGIQPEVAEGGEAKIRGELFSKGHPCMRASALTKRYGYGAHYNHEGKIALYPVESDAYQNFLKDDQVKKIPAMKNKR